MLRLALVLVALLSSACGGGAESPRSAETSSGAEAPAAVRASGAPSEPPPLPEPIEGTFSLPVRLPLAAVAERIDAELPRHEAHGYQQLTRSGKSPAIEARYEIWREPVHVRFAGSTLHVEVPLRYAARFNARLKNPFGGKWLAVARDEPWGTEAEPLRVTVHLRTRIEITRRWKLSLRTAVDPPEHGPPPSGKLCTGGSFKLCVGKSSIAPEVQKRMDAELLARLRRAATDFDRKAERSMALRSRVKRVFRELVRPRRFDEHDRWMTIEPRRAALALRAEGEAIVVEPALWARIHYHERRPDTTRPPLPKKSPLSKLPGERLPLPKAFAPAQLRDLIEAI